MILFRYYRFWNGISYFHPGSLRVRRLQRGRIGHIGNWNSLQIFISRKISGSSLKMLSAFARASTSLLKVAKPSVSLTKIAVQGQKFLPGIWSTCKYYTGVLVHSNSTHLCNKLLHKTSHRIYYCGVYSCCSCLF